MDKSAEMFKLVRQWRKSGLSQSEFCKPHGITVSKFGYWAGKEKMSKNSGSFIQIPAQKPVSNGSYEVVYPNGVKINYQGSNLTVLSELIKLY